MNKTVLPKLLILANMMTDRTITAVMGTRTIGSASTTNESKSDAGRRSPPSMTSPPEEKSKRLTPRRSKSRFALLRCSLSLLSDTYEAFVTRPRANQ